MNPVALSAVLLVAVACGDDAPARAATAAPGDAFCLAAQAAEDEDNRWTQIDPDDAEQVRATIAAIAEKVERLPALAPADATEIVAAHVARFGQQVDAFARNDYDFEAAGSELDAVAAATTGAKDAYDRYVADKCGVVQDDGLTVTGLVEMLVESVGGVPAEQQQCVAEALAVLTQEQLDAIAAETQDEQVNVIVGDAIDDCGWTAGS